LDDARLTDGRGRVVDFSNTVIILTSNLGQEHILTGTSLDGRITEATRELVLAEMKRFFRPEFLNRLDDVVIFSALTQHNLQNVVRIQIGHVAKRLAQRQIALRVSDAAVNMIVEAAYDPSFGARPLRRYLEKHIVTNVSRMLVSGELQEQSLVAVDVHPDGRLKFTVEPLPKDFSFEQPDNISKLSSIYDEGVGGVARHSHSQENDDMPIDPVE
jgi:ATP-dependent Clp protease ATP-binding subunit ClpB